MLFFIMLAASLVTGVFPGVFWPAVVTAAAAVLRRDEKRVYAAAFLGGVTADLVSGRNLGLSAGMLLFLVLGISLLRLRFQNRFWVAVTAALLFEGFYYFIVANFRF